MMKKNIKEAYEFISAASVEAYKDILLVSNPVLSKSPFTSNFLKLFLGGEIQEEHGPNRFIFKLFIYYIKSLLHFISYLFKFIQYRTSGASFYSDGKNGELILIDEFFLSDKIKESGTFRDSCFPGLEEVLKKKNSHYAYLPYFSGISGNKNPLELSGVFSILKREKVPVLCEFQLLSSRDLFDIFRFIMRYPFHVIRFSKTLKGVMVEEKLLKRELIDTIDGVTFYNFSRYLQGKRISELPYERIKVISWYENQPIHKNLYKGLKTNEVKIKIYGAQLLLYSRNNISLVPDENEKALGVLPDRIISNGPYLVPEKTALEYIVGPSFRYAELFNTTVARGKAKNILILLPYYRDDIENILRMVMGSNIVSGNIFIKAHPATTLEKYRHLIPPDAKIVDGSVYKLFESTMILISGGSGALVEAASLGIPVIAVKSSDRIDYNNSLPEYGRGIVWEEAGSAEELKRHIDMFEKKLRVDTDEIMSVANKYKQMFFCAPTEDSIAKAFDL